MTTQWGDDEELPVLPYGHGDNATAGWSGSDTSRERAHTERDEGTVKDRQRRALLVLSGVAARGMTYRELGEALSLHHGQSSGLLSVLHKDGRIARLAERRGRCKVYVAPEYVGGRVTEPQGRKAPRTAARRAAELAQVLVPLLADSKCPFHGEAQVDDCRWCDAILLVRAYRDEMTPT